MSSPSSSRPTASGTRNRSGAGSTGQPATLWSSDGRLSIQLDSERELAQERAEHAKQRRLPDRGGLSKSEMQLMQQVFKHREAPQTFDEALGDKLLRTECMVQMLQGRVHSLMVHYEIRDDSLARAAAARLMENQGQDAEGE